VLEVRQSRYTPAAAENNGQAVLAALKALDVRLFDEASHEEKYVHGGL
jgi:hypothetical protein